MATRSEPKEGLELDAPDALVLDLLEWIGSSPRPYAEVMDAWRTSCPRLPVWEEATQRGFVVRAVQGGAAVISLSPAGAAHLLEHRGPVR